MPNRVIRESMLDSERYWSVPIEARELYRHVQLLADDLGCVSLAPVMIRRRCFNATPQQSAIEKLIELLSDADLIRVYSVNGARFAFIPRFGQRLRRMYLRHPKPPPELYQDDPEAVEKFNKIKGNRLNLSDTSLTLDGHLSAESNLNLNQSGVSGSSYTPTRQGQKPLKHPPAPEATPEHVNKQKRVAKLLVDGKIDEAKALSSEGDKS
jgi:hypothetical protein